MCVHFEHSICHYRNLFSILMARRYLGRQRTDSGIGDNKDDEIDPLDTTTRRFVLQPNESSGTYREEPQDEFEETIEDLEETTEFVEATTEDLVKRVEKLKNLKFDENSDKDSKTLEEVEAKKEHESNPKSIHGDSAVEQIGNEVTDLISNNNRQRLKVMQLQIDAEKKNSERLSRAIQDKVKSIDEIEMTLTSDLSSKITNIIDESTKRKLKIMQLQLDSERKLSEELNAKIQENMETLSYYDEELRAHKKQLEIEVKEKTIKLLQAERLSAIGELAARVAHDLRNPLSVIKGAVELIKVKHTDAANEFIVRQSALIERAISRMSHQIEDVLDFVKPIPLSTKPNSILKTIKYALEKTKLSPQVKMNLPKEDIIMTFDANKMDVVFDNILTNAKQATDNQGEITIKFSEGDKFYIIDVIDSGPGIPEDILPKIFEPLVTTKQTGTGLGLASCLSIVKLHGGTIDAKNNPTTFTIKLPK